jgi:hypothetical protein
MPQGGGMAPVGVSIACITTICRPTQWCTTPHCGQAAAMPQGGGMQPAGVSIVCITTICQPTQWCGGMAGMAPQATVTLVGCYTVAC